jgi:GT2 family glycosyltransferase
MEDYPLVGLICLNYNGLSITYGEKPIIQLCIDSITSTSYENLKILVVDASSDDGSIEFIKSKYENIEHIKVPNIGWGANNNKGIQYLISHYPSIKYIALLSNDVLLIDPLWLNKMVSRWSQDTGIGIMTGTLIWPDGRLQFKGLKMSVRGVPTPNKKNITGFLKRNYFFNGAFFMVKREVFERVGLIDESYVMMNGEDLDFCVRAYDSGYLTYLLEDVSVVHLEDATVEKIKEGKFKGYDISASGGLEFNMRVNECVFILRHYKVLVVPWFLNGIITSIIGRKEKGFGNITVRKNVIRNLIQHMRVIPEAIRRYKRNSIPMLGASE